MQALFLIVLLQKHALMEQVAHQAIVMQFILDLAATLQVDPKGCFRHFFAKIKVCLLETFFRFCCIFGEQPCLKK